MNHIGGLSLFFRRILQGKCCMIGELLNGKVRNEVSSLLEGEKIKEKSDLTGCCHGGLN